ncbi:MAG: glycosyltransferase [Myxococcota bacterium]|nr:glycosyltransferase [Myxococcota bacterium]
MTPISWCTRRLQGAYGRSKAVPNPMCVAQFVSEFLPYSQTFIYQELIHHTRYQMAAFAQKRIHHGRFLFDPVTVVTPSNALAHSIERPIYLATGMSRAFLRRFETTRFSLIHAQFGPAAIYASLYADTFNLPLICTFGGRDVGVLCQPAHKNPAYVFYRLHVPRLFERLDRFLAVSDHLAQKLVSLGAPKQKVHVFYRGVTTPSAVPTRGTPSKGGPTVLMVGRFVEKKGFEYGVAAFARAIAHGRQARLKVIGSGKQDQRYDALARQLGVRDAVSFLGEMTQKEVFDEMRRAHILVVPSVTSSCGDVEGIPNVLKEGNAHGLPAIVTRHGGLPEVVEDGNTGFVVEERDIEALAEKLSRLIENHELRCAMGAAAWQKMRWEFDFQQRNQVLERHYDDVYDAFQARLGR